MLATLWKQDNLFMYPNLYYAFKDLFGREWTGLRFVNSFGFFVALAFVAAALVLASELRRKSKQGLLHYEEEKILIGQPATPFELVLNFLLGFILGYKIIGAFISDSPLTANPPDYIFSAEGSWPMGILAGLFFAGLKWWEKINKSSAAPKKEPFAYGRMTGWETWLYLRLFLVFSGQNCFITWKTGKNWLKIRLGLYYHSVV